MDNISREKSRGRERSALTKDIVFLIVLMLQNNPYCKVGIPYIICRFFGQENAFFNRACDYAGYLILISHLRVTSKGSINMFPSVGRSVILSTNCVLFLFLSWFYGFFNDDK